MSKLHLDVSVQQYVLLILRLSRNLLQEPELQMDVSTLERYVLLLKMSTQGPCGYLYIIIHTENSYMYLS